MPINKGIPNNEFFFKSVFLDVPMSGNPYFIGCMNISTSPNRRYKVFKQQVKIQRNRNSRA